VVGEAVLGGTVGGAVGCSAGALCRDVQPTSSTMKTPINVRIITFRARLSPDLPWIERWASHDSSPLSDAR
jgi:hypothetical protein